MGRNFILKFPLNLKKCKISFFSHFTEYKQARVKLRLYDGVCDISIAFEHSFILFGALVWSCVLAHSVLRKKVLFHRKYVTTHTVLTHYTMANAETLAVYVSCIGIDL